MGLLGDLLRERGFRGRRHPSGMGDRRYVRPYERVRDASDRDRALRQMTDDEVVQALAGASHRADALLANVLATAALNRMQRLRAALAHLGEGVVALGPRGEVQWSNPAADRLLGWDRASAMGRPFEDTVEHFDPEGERIPIERCRMMGTVLTGRVAHADGDLLRVGGGEPVCVEYTSAPILGPDQEPIGMVLAFRDCGERKRTERELREGRERYKSLFDNIPEPILSVGLDGELLDANLAAVELTARPIDQTRGHSFTEYLHPEDVESTLTLFQRVIAGDQQRTRLRILHADGHYIAVEAIGVPVLVDGEVVGIHGIVRRVVGVG